MKTPSLSDLERLAMIYFVANTPSYLYRHYRADQSVQSLSRNNDSKALVEYLVEILNEEKFLDLEMAYAYAVLVALTFKDLNEVESALEVISLDNLDWGNDIISMWSQTNIRTEKIKIKIESKPQERIIPSDTRKENDDVVLINMVNKPKASLYDDNIHGVIMDNIIKIGN